MLVILAFSSVQAFRYASEHKQVNEETEMFKSMMPSQSEPEQQDEIEQAEPQILAALKYLYNQNNDLIGWIKIDETVVNYPIMSPPDDDPEFYLSHDFSRQQESNGLPFLDTQCDIDTSDILLIHGHNRKNGLIFGELINYKQQEYFREHKTISFSSLYQEDQYEVIYVILSRVFYNTDQVFKYYQLAGTETEDGFMTYIQNLKELSIYETGADVQYGDKVLVLSTCEYSVENGRLVVIARKINHKLQQ